MIMDIVRYVKIITIWVKTDNSVFLINIVGSLMIDISV